MKQELIVTGSTIEEALRNGAEQLGVMPEELKYEVLVEPKKGILGIGRVAAKLKVCYRGSGSAGRKKRLLWQKQLLQKGRRRQRKTMWRCGL